MMTLPVVVSLLLSQVAAEQTVRRFALVAGANDGGLGRVTLRYATADAHAMAKVMTGLGGVDSRDVVELEDPTVSELTAALDRLSVRLKEAAAGQARVQVFFYYSGHSDEDGLLLKGERWTYAALRKRLDALPADVRIAVLDSCSSGALTLLKGGSARPPFLVDASSSLSGHAFLTSASADEAAQESERLKASIFTHYFLSGLRGAADASRDGRVTLTEAYQYAFAQTLSRTTSTRAGPQRPGYDIQLVGSGDLVLTDLRVSSARVVLDAALGGRVYVMDPDGGLVVEVAKAPGKSVELGLEPGEYRMVLDEGGEKVSQTQVVLAAEQTRTVTRESLSRTTLEATVLRGDAPVSHLPADITLVPPLGLSSLMPTRPEVNFELGVLVSRVRGVKGMNVSGLAAWVDEDLWGLAVAGGLVRAGVFGGLGASGGLFIASSGIYGMTAAGVTVSGADLVGFHASGASMALGDVTGVQVSGASVAVGAVTGVQIGMVSYAGEGFSGVQLSTVGVAPGVSTGAQLALVNVGGTLHGTQIGLVNIATAVHGLQLGLVNIAQTSDAPVGLFNIITRGHARVSAWTSETSVANVALKLGGEYAYSTLEVGMNPRGVDRPYSWSYGIGFGVHKQWAPLFGELEAAYESIHSAGGPWSEGVASAGLRLNVGYHVLSWLSVFAGPQVQVLIASGQAGQTRQVSPWGFDISDRVRIVPGATLGFQLF